MADARSGDREWPLDARRRRETPTRTREGTRRAFFVARSDAMMTSGSTTASSTSFPSSSFPSSSPAGAARGAATRRVMRTPRRDARARATPRRRSGDDHKEEENKKKKYPPYGGGSYAYDPSRCDDGSMASFADAIRDPALRRRAVGLEERLRDCVLTENFLAAARVRDELVAVRRRDPRARCEDDLREALLREDYRRAAALRAALEEMERDAAVEAATPCESERTTRGVRVRARSRFVADRSAPEEERWFFQYVVTITNVSAEGTVKLLSRSWLIVDDEGRAEAVRGAGVVGKQPSIRRGETFEYASSTPLKTCRGTMEGFYRFVAIGPREEARERASGGAVDLTREDDVDAFNVEIGVFGLSENAVF